MRTILTVVLVMLSACNVQQFSQKKVQSKPEAIDPFKRGAELDPHYIPTGYEGQFCVPEKRIVGQGACKQGLLCVPNLHDAKVGSCRKSCGETKDTFIIKNQSCPAGRTCQVLSMLKTDVKLGAFCMEQQLERDAPCLAEHDDQACDANRLCLPVNDKKGERTQLLCKEACVGGEHCSSNEFCVENETHDALCIDWVPWTSVQDLPHVARVGALCREQHGHSYCDQRLLDGLREPPMLECVGESAQSGGLCVALCSMPKDNEIKRLECPVGYTCLPDMGMLLDSGSYYISKEGNSPKTCQLNQCERGKPCPSECEGSTAAFCKPMVGATEVGACWIPFGFCNKEVA